MTRAMHYVLTYERVLHSAQVWCVDVSLLIRSIRSWILFILSSSSIHVSFSAQEKEELLAQQPSTSSEQDDSDGNPNAEESPVEVFEVRGSPQQSAAKKQRITAFALDIESLLPHLKQFLQAVKNYFTQTTLSVSLERKNNLERKKQKSGTRGAAECVSDVLTTF